MGGNDGFEGHRVPQSQRGEELPSREHNLSPVDGVDTLGDLAERAIEDWNNILEDLKRASKAKTVLSLREQKQEESLWVRLTQGYSGVERRSNGILDAEIDLGAGRRVVGVSSSDDEGIKGSSDKALNASTPTNVHTRPNEQMIDVGNGYTFKCNGSRIRHHEW